MKLYFYFYLYLYLFIIWTTTPWTLPASLGISLHPDLKYDVFEVNVEELNLDYGASTLAQKIAVSSEEDSQVVSVTVSDPDQETAAIIANEVVSTFENEIPDIMNVDNVSVLTDAEVAEDPSPVKPNVTLNIAIGLILGLMIGIGLAFLREYLDTTIKTEADIERQIGVPVIGIVSTVGPNDIDEKTQGKDEQQNTSRRSQD